MLAHDHSRHHSGLVQVDRSAAWAVASEIGGPSGLRKQNGARAGRTLTNAGKLRNRRDQTRLGHIDESPLARQVKNGDEEHDRDRDDRHGDDGRRKSGVRQSTGANRAIGAVIADRSGRCSECAEHNQRDGDRTPATYVTELLHANSAGDDGQRRPNPGKERALVREQKARVCFRWSASLGLVGCHDQRLPAGFHSTSPSLPGVVTLA